jgi:Adenylate and Guanylate cyclase catalytic domain
LILDNVFIFEDLGIRIGLHSGPVTAGILRGEKSRFQLFGDTVNTCAHMEGTGSTNRIHISQQTADMLIVAGKASWIEKKENKDLDDVDTYWLAVRVRSGSGTSGSEQGSSEGNSNHNPEVEAIDDDNGCATQIEKDTHRKYFSNEVIGSIQHAATNEKIKRLVDWNSEMLLRLLKQIIAYRRATADNNSNQPKDFFFRRASNESSFQSSDADYSSTEFVGNTTDTVINEVVEIIDIPEFDSRTSHDSLDPSAVELDDVIRQEVKDFVKTIALLYRDNPFHNYEHASHVTMSVAKLLSRIIAPDRILNDSTHDDKNDDDTACKSTQSSTIASTLHDHTYGITSDPMIQFACVFSAFIHDVDHPGK